MREGVLWLLVARGLTVALQFGALLVLARHLGPDDFGLAGMVAVVLGVVGVAADLGMETIAVRPRADDLRATWLSVRAGLACAIAVWLAYTATYGFSDAGLPEFERVVADVFDVQVLVGFVLKCMLFGLAVALIPVATGLEAERGDVKSAPHAVLGGLVTLFFVIGLIEVLSLVGKYL